MSVSLYRKYRPARFEDVIGQAHVARTLVNAINQDRVSHAYLFAGPRGTGKTSTAKILAMALNCEAGHGKATATPDGTCPLCEAIRRGSALDVVEMDAASNRGIDDIRDLRDKVHFAPVEGRMKVYIVDEVHMLTPEAFNALLKTLEEPPVHAIFVLATTEPHKVPATILSRCQRFDFRRPSIAEVVEVLASVAQREAMDVSENSLIVIARAAGGSFRDAIGILDQLSTYCDGHIGLQETLDILGLVEHDLLFEIVDIVAEQDTQGALLFVERLNQSGSDFNQFLKDLLGHLRDLYVVKHTAEMPASIAMSEEQLDTLRSQANRASTPRVLAFIDLIGEALRTIRQGSDPRLELELVLIKMTALGHGGSRFDDAIASAPTFAPPARAGITAPPAASGRSAQAPATPRAETPATARPKHAQTAPAQPAAPSDASEFEEEESWAEHLEPAPAQEAAPETDAAEEPGPDAQPGGSTVTADVEHLRRAWPVILGAVKRRKPGLFAVLSEGRPESLEGDELVIRFPAGFGFQANQASRDDSRQVLSEALHQITGRHLRVVTRVASEPSSEPEQKEEGARILGKDELIQVLKQEFDARVIDDGPAHKP